MNECPICGNNVLLPFLECKDNLVSHQTFAIQQCATCSFRLTNPRPGADTIGSYYQSDEYVSHNDKSGGLINTAYRMVRNYTLRAKLKLVNKLNSRPGRLLDIGCGTGAFLETCLLGGWEIMGIEPDKNARAVTQKKLKIDIKPNLNTIGKEGVFDIITMWHVLEHVPNLNETIEQLTAHLSDEGVLVVAVPNSNSYDAEYFREYWAAYDVPRHLHHFTPSTIQHLFKKHRLKLIDQKPMPFDAFYISMLSTRYKSGKIDYLKSIEIGIKSNRKAKRTGNSSSQIYLIKKA